MHPMLVVGINTMNTRYIHYKLLNTSTMKAKCI